MADFEYIEQLFAFKLWKKLHCKEKKVQLSQIAETVLRPRESFKYQQYQFLPRVPNDQDFNKYYINIYFDLTKAINWYINCRLVTRVIRKPNATSLNPSVTEMLRNLNGLPKKASTYPIIVDTIDLTQGESDEEKNVTTNDLPQSMLKKRPPDGNQNLSAILPTEKKTDDSPADEENTLHEWHRACSPCFNDILRTTEEKQSTSKEPFDAADLEKNAVATVPEIKENDQRFPEFIRNVKDDIEKDVSLTDDKLLLIKGEIDIIDICEDDDDLSDDFVETFIKTEGKKSEDEEQTKVDMFEEVLYKETKIDEKVVLKDETKIDMFNDVRTNSVENTAAIPEPDSTSEYKQQNVRPEIEAMDKLFKSFCSPPKTTDNMGEITCDKYQGDFEFDRLIDPVLETIFYPLPVITNVTSLLFQKQMEIAMNIFYKLWMTLIKM